MLEELSCDIFLVITIAYQKDMDIFKHSTQKKSLLTTLPHVYISGQAREIEGGNIYVCRNLTKHSAFLIVFAYHLICAM